MTISISAVADDFRECVHRMNCDDIKSLTDKELDYVITALPIIEKEKVTFEDLQKLTVQTRNYVISQSQMSDINLNRLISLPEFEEGGMDEELINFMVNRGLHRLFYNFNNDLSLPQQIKEFQQDNGFKVTGILTWGQFGVLNEISNINEPTRIYLDGTAEVYSISENNYIFVSGTWDIIGEDEAFPINKSVITCDKSTNKCIDEYERMLTHKTIRGIKVPNSVYVSDSGKDEYEIVLWDDQEIIAKQSGSQNGCRSVKLNINHKTSDVQQVTTQNEDNCPMDIPRLESARVAKLISSMGFQSKYWRKLENNVKCFYSKKHIKYLNTTSQKVTGKIGTLCQGE